MSDIVPAGISFIVNTVRLGAGELAATFMVRVEQPTLVADVAAEIDTRAAALITKPAMQGAHQLITVNLFEPSGQGGCSWQCLTTTAGVDREPFAAAVGGVAADMMMHALRSFLSDVPVPARPRTVN